MRSLACALQHHRSNVTPSFQELSATLPAKLPQHIFGGFMCLGNLAFENLVESREETFGGTTRSLKFV